ncbi:MAG: ABC transporter permease [Solirubrobacteraceae bacterium]
MRRDLSRLLWFETCAAILSGSLMILTVLWRDWVEVLFGVDPDHHSGSLEWFLLVGSISATALLAVAARHEWNQATLYSPDDCF